MWAKEEAQKRQAKRAAISKKAEQVEHVPKVDLNARGLPERVHTQKTAGQATVQNNVVPAKPRQHPTGKMVTPAEAEKKLMTRSIQNNTSTTMPKASHSGVSSGRLSSESS